MTIDARSAYEVLTRIERRLAADRLEDFAAGIDRITWPFLTNAAVIARLERSGRISGGEASLLDRIGKRQRRAPTTDNDDLDVYPDVYELLLTLFPIMGIDDQLIFRGHADYRWLLVPKLFREAPVPEELLRRQRQTFAFIQRLVSFGEAYRIRAENDDPSGFIELLAVAQHYGLPTHLLDFTSDLRIAAFFAALDAPADGNGEILVLRTYEYEKFGDAETNPYGVRVTRSAPNPRIERQKGLFIAGFVPAAYQDTSTSFLERLRFRHDGRTFPGTGGYEREYLLDESGADPISTLARECEDDVLSPSPVLSRHFERYAAYVEETSRSAIDSMSEEDYARACAWPLRLALPDTPEWIDVQVAKLFALIQLDLRHAPVREFFRHALRARHAMDVYLQSPGTPEERLASAVNLTWLNSTLPGTGEHTVISRTVDKHIDEFNRDVNA